MRESHSKRAPAVARGVAAIVSSAALVPVGLGACGGSRFVPSPHLIAVDGQSLESGPFRSTIDKTLRPVLRAAYAQRGTAVPVYAFASHTPIRVAIPGLPCMSAGPRCKERADEWAADLDFATILAGAAASVGSPDQADTLGAVKEAVGYATDDQAKLVVLTTGAQRSDTFDTAKVDLSTEEGVDATVDELEARQLLPSKPSGGGPIVWVGIGTGGAAAASATRAAQERDLYVRVCRRAGVTCEVMIGGSS